jgi:Response regulator of the LytR/AlgR family
MMIRSVIVEDEPMARESLRLLLQRYCPDVMICAEAVDVKSGKSVIEKFRPDLVFLDIEMPDGSGFRLLKSFEKIDFEVVFTTAFDQFAIKAIRHAALDYLLKPINPDELKAAVEKVKVVKQKKTNQQQIEVLLNSIKPEAFQTKKVVLSTSEKVYVVEVNDIIRCESDNYYTNFFFKDGTTLLISKTLKEVESMLEEYNFVRPHKSHLVNSKYIMNFTRDEGVLVLTDGSKVPVSRRKKEHIMELLNNL